MSAIVTNNSFAPEEVVIGTQTWMKKNYDFGGYYFRDNPLTIHGETIVNPYGKLYTWDQAKAINVFGWHLPSNTEWDTLMTYLGGTGVAGGYMKEAGTDHWTTPNTGADNSSGFTAVGSGSKNYNNDDCGFLNNYSFFWSADSYDVSYPYYYYLAYNNNDFVQAHNTPKEEGFSVRLIKD